MNWLFFALLSPLFFAIVVDIDKYILEKHVDDYRGMPIYGSIVALIFGIVLWIIGGFPVLSLRDTLLIIFTGMLTIWGNAIYFKALSTDEASKLTILFQMTPIIALILSFLFLKETISFNQFIGFLLILFATIGISYNKKDLKINFSSTFILILFTDFLWAISYVLFKFIVDTNSFYKIISYESFGIALGGLVLYTYFPSIRNAFLKTNKKIGKTVLKFVFFNEGLYVFGRLLNYFAISLGPVGLISVVGGTQVFFAIGLGWILTLSAPKIFRENISREGLYKKISMAILVLAGLWFIQG